MHVATLQLSFHFASSIASCVAVYAAYAAAFKHTIALCQMQAVEIVAATAAYLSVQKELT